MSIRLWSRSLTSRLNLPPFGKASQVESFSAPSLAFHASLGALVMPC